MAANPLEDTFGRLHSADATLRRRLYTPTFSASLQGHQPCEHIYDALAPTAGAAWSDRLMQAHMQTVLADDYLPKVDLATIGASLEGRCPFLDFDLVELAMRMPQKVRFRGGRPKGLLRELARRYLPAAGVDRRKQGFDAPIGLWFRLHWNDLTGRFILGPNVRAPSLVSPRGARTTGGRTCPRRRPRPVAVGAADPGTVAANGGGEDPQSRGNSLNPPVAKTMPAKVTHLIATLMAAGRRSSFGA